jgi:hypothetical protein
LSLHPASDLYSNAGRALIASSLWLHIGFIGASVLAVGLLQLFDGEANLPWALALAFSGGLLAAATWHRGLTVLQHAERASAATDAPSGSTSRASPKRDGLDAINDAVPHSTAFESETR